ncbi:hypothetical protein PZA11_000896 [Diplocarpon coronariae]|uniref:Uncharacterized protein n=1 Tax=Diplocarpon coronariae TaxID=2795749 RepID=A0A218ZDQ4_9HELO|nr:hypothetical protein JHW43_007427 [Diplocarpon mali]OWP05663.1 hypothetical protein B2J93_1712 [Marssonina coronariae]
MAPLLEDPRYRQTWNQLSQNAESATESAAAGIWTFQHKYISPCFASIASSVEQCTGPCFPDREERARRIRERGRTRGRAELSFDFYDDWDEENDGRSGGLLGGWGNDELDRLLTGSGSHSGPSGGVDQAPRRKRGMSYGTRGVRRKSLEPDPTVIPSTSALGFLGRLPFKLGGTLRYKPSAADLQDHPGASRSDYNHEEGQPLLPEDHGDDEGVKRKGHHRNRSSTASSGETTDSMRSRGDLFPSDGEDDAVPLSDEFAMVLERRMTNTDDKSSGKTRSSKGKRPSGSRTVSRTMSRTTQSSQSRPSLHRASSVSLPQTPEVQSPGMVGTPSLSDLQREEERVWHEEELDVERKRQAAVKLAVDRGLHIQQMEAVPEAKMERSQVETITTPDEVAVGAPTNTGSGETVQGGMPKPACSNQAEKNFIPARLPHFS